MTISIQVSIVDHRRTRNIHWRFFFLLPNQKECKILPCGALHCFFIHFFESVCFRFPSCYAQVLQDLRHFSYVWFFLCNVRSDGGCLYLCLLFDRDRCMISNPRGRVSWPCLISFLSVSRRFTTSRMARRDFLAIFLLQRKCMWILSPLTGGLPRTWIQANLSLWTEKNSTSRGNRILIVGYMLPLPCQVRDIFAVKKFIMF